MRDLEAEMAKALDGRFFWEHTATPEDLTTGDSREIVIAQRKFQTPKRPPTEEEKKARLQSLVESKRKSGIAAKNVCHLSEVEVRAFADYLTKVISDVYGVPDYSVRKRNSGPGYNPAKHHLSWALVRYFPNATITLISKSIDRNHATILHSCKMFDSMKDGLAIQVAAVDTIVGYTN